FAYKVFQRRAGDSADNLADQVTVIDQVIARGGPRGPPWRLAGQPRRRLSPVVHVLECERRVPSGHTRCPAENVSDLDVLLAVCRELRPVPGDWGEHVERAAGGQH